jgi:predicted secreted hydrolase
MEWWYTIYHLETPEGRKFSIMGTFFMPQMELSYRPFNITDVEGQQMFDTAEWGTLTAAEDRLDLSWHTDYGPISTFANQTDSKGRIIPFHYEQNLRWEARHDPARSQSLSLMIETRKAPFIVGGDGYVTIGDSGESYYYTLSHMAVHGELELNGQVFQVSGVGWLDHQWGPFLLHPNASSENSYEWMALHLDNGDEYMVSSLFDRENRLHKVEGFGGIGWVTSDCAQAFTLDYTVERLSFWQDPVTGAYYSHTWRIQAPERGLDLFVEPVMEDQTVTFILTTFYEGRSLVTGTVEGQPVQGLAFAELVHRYEPPELSILAPASGATVSTSVQVQWEILNPDDGMPVTCDVVVSDGVNTETVCDDVTAAAECTANLASFSGPVTLTVQASSTDGLITGETSQPLTVTP